MIQNEIAREFLDEFFEYALEDGQTFAVWTKGTRKHTWVSSPEEGAFIAEKFKGEDCYFSVGTYPAGTDRRTQDSTSQIVGVWLDVDVGDKGNGRNYFASMDEAIEWVNASLTGMWSILVHSGGGLHVYLLFEEPLNCASLDDHDRARKIVKAYHQWASSTTSFDLDPVTDLSRVMRLPGTMNTKAGQVCQIIEQNGKRVSVSELEDLLPEYELDDTGQEADLGEVKHVEWEVLSSRISMMCEVDDKFRRTWSKARRFKDDSPSTYCMSLADLLCSAGFSNSEVLTALRKWRTIHGAKHKPDSWFNTTVLKARAQHKEVSFDHKFDATATKALEQLAPPKQPTAAPAEEPKPVSPAESTALADLTTEIFGSAVQRFVRVQPLPFLGIRERPSYRIEFEKGSLHVPGSAQLMSQAYLKQILFDEIGVTMRTMKGSKFDQMLRILKAIEEVEEMAPEGNVAYMIATLIEEILEEKIEQVEVVEDLALWNKHLVLAEGDTYWVSFDLVANRVSQRVGTRMSNRELSEHMRLMGLNAKRFGEKRIRLWEIKKNLTAQE